MLKIKDTPVRDASTRKEAPIASSPGGPSERPSTISSSVGTTASIDAEPSDQAPSDQASPKFFEYKHGDPSGRPSRTWREYVHDALLGRSTPDMPLCTRIRIALIGDGIRTVDLDFFHVFWIFMACSIGGLIVETVWFLFAHGQLESRAGLVWGPFSPIYGVGGVLMSFAVNYLDSACDLAVYAITGGVGAFFELVAGWFWKNAFGIVA